MHKKLFVLLGMIVYYTHTFLYAQSGKFEIIGEVDGFPDSTLIYLHEMDSTFIIHNKFYFSGMLKEEASNVILRTKDFEDYKFFWLENARIRWKAKKGNFRAAKITGSKTQDDQQKLDDAIAATENAGEQNRSFIRSHPNSVISVHTLNIYASTWGRDSAAALYGLLSNKMKQSDNGKDILEFIGLNRNVQVGNKYVDFTEQNIEGKRISLSDLQGKVVLLEFWGSWCAPCRSGHPELVNIYQQFHSSGFEILGVAADTDSANIADAVSKDGLLWENVSDLRGRKNKAVLMYGVSYYPANFLIDRNGTIIAKDLRGDALQKKLKEMLPAGAKR